MEFLGGILFTIIALFFGYKIYQALQKRKARAEYIPPNDPNRPVRDFPQATYKDK